MENNDKILWAELYRLLVAQCADVTIRSLDDGEKIERMRELKDRYDAGYRTPDLYQSIIEEVQP